MSKFLKFAVIVAAVAISSGSCGEVEDIKTALAAVGPLKPELGDSKQWFKGIETWQAPKKMAAELPYYIAGYDYEKRPVVIWEIGKWDIRKFIDADAETADTYHKYAENFWWRLSNITSESPDSSDAEQGITLICDATGFTNRQMTSVAAIQSHLKGAKWSAWAESNIADFMLINVNFAIRTWISILRPISGPLFGRVDLYGTRTETWIPELRRKIPADQLPPWYGGSGNFKPVQVFG